LDKLSWNVAEKTTLGRRRQSMSLLFHGCFLAFLAYLKIFEEEEKGIK
jgi:hypothetical protein